MVKHLTLFLFILLIGCEMNSEQLIKSENINFENIKFNAVSKDLKFTNIQEGPEVGTTKRLVGIGLIITLKLMVLMGI